MLPPARLPSQPTLVDLRIGDRMVPALVQPTKQGEVFVLDRRSGEPVLPVHEVPAPQGAAQGDHTHPTQPRSALSFAPLTLRGRRERLRIKITEAGQSLHKKTSGLGK